MSTEPLKPSISAKVLFLSQLLGSIGRRFSKGAEDKQKVIDTADVSQSSQGWQDGENL